MGRLPGKRLLLAALVTMAAGPAARAEPAPGTPPGAVLECTCTYGPESWVLTATPTTDPYRVAPVKVGERFLFRMVWVAGPADEAAVNLYAYYPDADETPVLVHQSKYVPPWVQAGTDARYGFTGLNRVYELRTASEFQFWCRWREP